MNAVYPLVDRILTCSLCGVAEKWEYWSAAWNEGLHKCPKCGYIGKPQAKDIETVRPPSSFPIQTKLDLLIVLDGLYVAGVQKVVEYNVSGLGKRFNSAVACLYGGGLLVKRLGRSVPIYVLDISNYPDESSLLLMSLCKKASVINCHLAETAAMLKQLNIKDLPPIIVTIHTEADHPDEEVFMKELTTWDAITALVFVDDALARQFETVFPGLQVKKTVVPNYVPQHLFHFYTKSRSQRWTEMQKNLTESRRILYVGRLDQDKGATPLISSYVSRWHGEVPIVMRVVGDGNEQHMLEHVSCGPNVNLQIEGVQDNVNPYYEWADLFLLVSRREVAPVAVVEAQLAGVPVLAANVGSIPKMLCRGKCGWYFHSVQEAIVLTREIFSLKWEYVIDKVVAARRQAVQLHGRAALLGYIRVIEQEIREQ